MDKITKSITLSDHINILQVFERVDDTEIVEYHAIEVHESASGNVHTINFTGREITSEGLRVLADMLEHNRKIVGLIL